MSKFVRRNLEDTLSLIVNFTKATMSKAVFAQSIGGSSISSGNSQMKIVDLKFYGLVTIEKGKDAVYTEICRDLKEDVAPNKKQRAKILAFLNDKQFRKVYDAYKGTIISFNDVVVAEIADVLNSGINYANQFTTVFKDGGIFAGVLIPKANDKFEVSNVDDVLSKEEESKEKPIVSTTSVSQNEEDRAKSVDQRKPSKSEDTDISININLNIDNSTTDDTFDRMIEFVHEIRTNKAQSVRTKLLVTQPPTLKELRIEVEKMIGSAREEILVVTPYIDNEILHILLPKAEQQVKVVVVTRDDSQVKGNEPQEALKHLKEHKQIVHYSYKLVHSRILLVDKSIALVSSADMSHDSLEGQFNAGILTSDPSIVKKCTQFVDMLIKNVKRTQKKE